METRELFKRIVALLDDDEAVALTQAVNGEAPARQPRKPDYEPSAEAIRSATLEIQAEWTDDDRLIRSGRRSPASSWIVPNVKLRHPIEQDD
jgi:hypothetical protein